MSGMKAYTCRICGYTYEGESRPKRCPFCNTEESFAVQESGKAQATVASAGTPDQQAEAFLQQWERTEEPVNALDKLDQREFEKIRNVRDK